MKNTISRSGLIKRIALGVALASAGFAGYEAGNYNTVPRQQYSQLEETSKKAYLQKESDLNSSHNEVRQKKAENDSLENRLSNTRTLLNAINETIPVNQSADSDLNYREYSLQEFDAIMSPKLRDYSANQKKAYFDSLKTEEVSLLCTANKNAARIYSELPKEERDKIKQDMESMTPEAFAEIKAKFPYMQKDSLTLGDIITIEAYKSIKDFKFPSIF